MYTCPMTDLIDSLVLVGASVGIATVLGTLVWYWVRLSRRYRKHYPRW